MNIFPLEKKEDGNIDWIKSAYSHDNLRVNKMILESTQMICTAINEIYGKQIAPYKSVHVNHPCTKWTRKSVNNFFILLEFTEYLGDVFFQRNGKIHKSIEVIQSVRRIVESEDIASFKAKFELENETELPLCMPEKFKQSDVVESYRNYWCSKPEVCYNIDDIPIWFKEKRKIPFKIKLPHILNKQKKPIIVNARFKNTNNSV